MDNLYSVDPGPVKDPDLSVVQKTSHSEKSSDEEDLTFYVI